MSAKLPVNYVAAKGALAKCTRVDECRKWKAKAQALASYGRQMEDQSLIDMAERIRARAVQRGGELLREVKAQKGGDRKSKGPERPIDRKTAARDAGLSDRQAKTMLRVANVPKDLFETMVEAKTPARVKELADIGTQKRAKPQPAPYRAEYLDWTQAVEHIAALPACGLDVLAGRCPNELADLKRDCIDAINNLATWQIALEAVHVESNENDVAA